MSAFSSLQPLFAFSNALLRNDSAYLFPSLQPCDGSALAEAVKPLLTCSQTCLDDLLLYNTERPEDLVNCGLFATDCYAKTRNGIFDASIEAHFERVGLLSSGETYSDTSNR